MTQTLILSPGSFPWELSGESSFLGPELRGAQSVFDRLILAPQSMGGAREELSPDVELTTSLAERLSRQDAWSRVRSAAVSGVIAEEVLRRPRDLLSGKAAKELLAHAARARVAHEWLRDLLRERRLDPSSVTVSTFWWTPATTGFAMLRRSFPGLRVFTRAHGFDLYEDRHEPAYIPARTLGLRWLCRVFPDSSEGTLYLRRAFPWASQLIETSRLGVDDPRVLSQPSRDGTLRIVTCALVRPIKRLHLLVDGLEVAVAKAPNQRFEWTHFGLGPDIERLKQRAARLPPAATVRFAGYSTQAALFEAYATRPVDVCVNLSVSEGTSVALMEAIACGIPLLVTAVGGNVEVGRKTNAVWLSPNPTAEEIAAGLLRFTTDNHDALARRAASRALWESDYDAQRNAAEHFTQLRRWPDLSSGSRAPLPTGS